MRSGILKQFLEVDVLAKAVVLFWPLWFVCSAVLAIAMETLSWEPPLTLVSLLVISPVVMLGVVWRGSRQEYRSRPFHDNEGKGN